MSVVQRCFSSDFFYKVALSTHGRPYKIYSQIINDTVLISLDLRSRRGHPNVIKLPGGRLITGIFRGIILNNKTVF